ncbi:class I SAM-dependent methyltransferase [Streptomyces sp. NPDC002838]|uniref:class I SAM-dependent methyltransferase n=1 Tax=Streptomyces sp. NPDC002838 TaxID=3154436 RepID=UPI00332FD250
MIHENPLAYLLGLEGIALLRSFTGEFDQDFVDSRIAEIRKLLDDESLANAAVDVARVSTVEGYRIWSETYDGPNSAFAYDEPVLAEIVAGLPKGVALDAACGTGRLSALLAERGHRIIGVDSSPDMLARARERVPAGEFHLGDLSRLPVSDDAVDLIVCSLALTHVRDLKPVLAEFARVLRPGGHLVMCDIHPHWLERGAIPPVRLPDGTPGRLESHRHLVGDYLRAALPLGLRVRRCEEPTAPPGARSEPQDTPQDTPSEPTSDLGPWELWPWSLAATVPEAAAAANAVPSVLIWHFQLTDPAPRVVNRN